MKTAGSERLLVEEVVGGWGWSVYISEWAPGHVVVLSGGWAIG